MTGKHISLNKVEMAELTLQGLIECDDLTPGQRQGLESALTLVRGLRPSDADSAEHLPVLWEPGFIGCTCGFKPEHRPSRGSMMMAPYHSHLARLNLPRSNVQPIYGFGPKKGQPM